MGRRGPEEMLVALPMCDAVDPIGSPGLRDPAAERPAGTLTSHNQEKGSG